jgi:hypothetical protein
MTTTDERNTMFVNKVARAARLFADKVECKDEQDIPDVAGVRAAFEELFAVWQDVDAGLIDEEGAR